MPTDFFDGSDRDDFFQGMGHLSVLNRPKNQ